MTSEQALAFLIFSFVAAVTPGPSNVMLAATGAIAGLRRGLPCLAGVLAGMGLLILVVTLGVGQLVLAHRYVLAVLNWAGTAYLLWLAWRIATSPPPGAHIAGKPIGFAGAFAFQWVNPKSWLVAAAAAGTYLSPDSGAAVLQAAWFAGLFVTAALPATVAWLALGAAMRNLLREPRRARMFNVAMGVALAASVAMIHV